MSLIAQTFQRDQAAKLLAVIAAILLWGRVSLEERVQMNVDASVVYRNLPAELEIHPDEAAAFGVVIEGRRSQVEELKRRGLSIEADFSNIDASRSRTLTVAAETLDLPSGVQFVKATPSQLQLSLEPTASREVEVVPELSSTQGSEYELAGYSVHPERLTIVGPRDRLSFVQSVSAGPIDLSEVVGRRSFRATALLTDPYLRFSGDPTVNVEVRMRRR